MSTPTIPAGNLFMNAVLRTASSSPTSVTSLAFQPDLIWDKPRSNAGDNELVDSIRGASKLLQSNTTSAEATAAQFITSFNSNGFSLGTADWTAGWTIVDWCWKAGGTAVTNTSGTISSQVSANTTSGFSVVTFTGTGSNATVGHGLGVAPSMIITKQRNTTGQWNVYHASLGNTKVIYLNLTDAQNTDPLYWNSTSPTSSVFTIGTAGNVNTNGTTYVAYCWAPIAGYSQFGSYTGNGSADGPFIYTGFRPRFVLIKASSTGGAGYDWFIHDTSRDTYNQCTLDLEANLSASENGYGAELDILSNGFKLRNTGGGTNQSSVTYIYMAFAENPFKYANAR